MKTISQRCVRLFGKLFLSILLPLIIFGFLPGNADVITKPTPTDLPPRQNLPAPQQAVFDPPSFDHFFHYNISERCQRNFPWSAFGTSNLSIPAPAGYNSTTVNISFQVINPALNETAIVSNADPLFANRTQQAQGFFTSTDTLFSGFSIYIPTNRPNTTPLTMQLRNDTYAGDLLASFPIILVQGPGWLDVTVSTAIFLPKGHYYLYLPATGGTQTNAWGHTINGTAHDSWVFDGVSWALQNWNLTLKIRTYNVLQPSAVGMTVTSQPVADLGNGRGWVNLTKTITENPVTFIIGNTTPIAYSCALNATYYRHAPAGVNVSLSSDFPNWTLALPPNDPAFGDYQGNLTGIRPDYWNIQAFNGTTSVGYSRPDSMTIIFASFANSLSFLSPNYISTVQGPDIAYAGSSVMIGVDTLSPGNISANIYNDSAGIYQNSTLSTGHVDFSWNVDEASQPGLVTLQVYYVGDNEIGVNTSFIKQNTDASLDVSDLVTLALDPATLNCRYYDPFSQVSITGAQVSFSVENLVGSLTYLSSGNYSAVLELGQYALVPGPYNLTLTASKDGVRPQNVTISLVIVPRPVNVRLTLSTPTVALGQMVQFNVELEDDKTSTFLDHPINVSLILHLRGNDPTQRLTTYKFLRIIQSAQYSWLVPTDLALGTYDVEVIVEGDYYTGSSFLPGGLTLTQPVLWWPLLLGAMAAGALGAGIYVDLQKVHAKRSVKGLMILHTTGAPVAEHISPSFSKMDTVLISGAIAGIIALIREITGRGLRTIRIEGGYLELNRGESFWSVLLMHKKPTWIHHTIEQMVADIEMHHGTALRECCNGERIPIDIPEIVARHFGVNLDDTRNFRTATRPEDHENDLLPPNKGSTPLSGL